MKLMKQYLQYLPDTNQGKIITGLQMPELLLLEELLETSMSMFTTDDALKMRISFLEPDSDPAKGKRFAFSLDDYWPDPLFAEQYVRAVRGELADYEPIMVLLHTDAVVFLIAAPDEDGTISMVSSVRTVCFPPGAQIRIDFAPDADGAARSYLIDNHVGSAEDNIQYEITCLINGQTDTVRTLERDDAGALFERITEADDDSLMVSPLEDETVLVEEDGADGAKLTVNWGTAPGSTANGS